MGADRFDHFVSASEAKTIHEAFTKAVADAAYDHGHSGYTGTIAEKDSFEQRNGGKPLTKAEAESFSEEDGDEQSKWDPAYCVSVKADDSDSIIGYLFYGWASSVLALFFILATTPAFAQKAVPVRPIHLPALQAPRYTAPKPVAVQMPRPAKNAYRFPVIKTVHMPAPHYR